MLNVDYSKAKEVSAEHLSEIKTQLQANHGLEYCPREQTPEGRQYEIAADTSQLIKHLKTLPDGDVADFVKIDFDVKLLDVDDESDESDFISFKRSHFDLCLRANGKAELYFHSYFWTTYLTSLLVACG